MNTVLGQHFQVHTVQGYTHLPEVFQSIVQVGLQSGIQTGEEVGPLPEHVEDVHHVQQHIHVRAVHHGQEMLAGQAGIHRRNETSSTSDPLKTYNSVSTT